MSDDHGDHEDDGEQQSRDDQSTDDQSAADEPHGSSDDGGPDDHGSSDSSEADTEFGRRAEDERQRASESDDVVETPEGKFPADAKGFDGTPVEQILKDRDERLDPDNRPENTEVSNAGREFNVAKGMFTDEEGFDEAPEQFTAEDP